VHAKPWGNKDPVYFDLWQDSKLVQLQSKNRDSTLALKGGAFEKGVWYYSGIPLSDHHDIAGFENPNRVAQTCMGIEYRP
jgi:hypothetical protein